MHLLFLILAEVLRYYVRVTVATDGLKLSKSVS